jgi:hypothetical protein
MNGTTVFGGSTRAHRARGRGGDVAAGGGSQVRGERQLRGQAAAALAGAGTLEPERIGGRKRSTLAAHGERVQALLAAAPDLTIAELRSRLAAAGIAVSRSALGRFLIAAGLTRTKRVSTPPRRTAPMSPPRGAPGARSSRP